MIDAYYAGMAEQHKRILAGYDELARMYNALTYIYAAILVAFVVALGVVVWLDSRRCSGKEHRLYKLLWKVFVGEVQLR